MCDRAAGKNRETPTGGKCVLTFSLMCMLSMDFGYGYGSGYGL